MIETTLTNSDSPLKAYDIPLFRRQFTALVDSAESILLATTKADEDGTASMLLLYSYLGNKHPFKSIRMACVNYANARWAHLKGFNEIVHITSLKNYLGKFPLIIFLDTSEYFRFGISEADLRSANMKTICIDHHKQSLTRTFDVSLIIPEATSTAELIYSAFYEQEPKIDTYQAELILTGILGDTGTLKYMNSARAHVYSIIQRLIVENNIDLGSLISLLRQFPEHQFRIIQEFIRNARIERNTNWPPYVITSLSRAFIEKDAFSYDDVEEAANFFASNLGMIIEDSHWGVAFYPRSDNEIKVKIRTQPRSVNARVVMEALGIGSGHSWSASGRFITAKESSSETQFYIEKFTL